jgi:curli biogenesis system outer membrane secretion channel CsgG
LNQEAYEMFHSKLSITSMILLVGFSAGAVAADKTPPVMLPRCAAPLASVMIGKMQCKAANCNAATPGAGQAGGIAALIEMVNSANGGVTNVTGIADGIKDVLTTALTETGCFSVQDRDQMDEIAQELGRTGKTVQAEQAEFLISGAVTEIDVSVQNKSFGAGMIPIVGSIGKRKQSASVSLDMKLVSVNSAKVLASRRATATTETSSTSIGGFGAGFVGGNIGGFGGSFSNLKGSNLEAVTKDAIAQSVIFLVEAVTQAKAAPATAQVVSQTVSN